MGRIRKYFSAYREHYPKLGRLALPIIIGQLGIIIVGFADTIMVGRHSTAELAAASFVNNVMNAFIIFGMGFSFNLTPLVGECLARGRRRDIGGWLKNSLWANFGMSLVLMGALGLVYLNLDRLGQPEELLPLIRPYYAVSLFSLLFVMLYNAFRQFVEAIGQPTVSMWVLLAGNVLNILGNYLLIYGKAGFAEMGLLGAGISTFVSRFLMLLLFVGVFLTKAGYLDFRRGFFSRRFSRTAWRKLYSLGLPIGLQQGMEAATFSLTAIMVGWLGSMALAAHQIAITISTISYTVLLGIGSAVAIRASLYRGLGDWNAIRKTTVAGIHIGLGVSALMSLVLLLTRHELSYIFTDSAEVASIVVTLLPVLMVYMFGDCMQILYANALRGVADVKSIMAISFVVYFIVAVPSGYLLGFVWHGGCPGIWMAYPVGFVLAALLMGKRMAVLVRRNLMRG